MSHRVTEDCLGGYDPSCPTCVRHDEQCGKRCEGCDERLCEFFGPEPATTCEGHTYCTDCDQTNRCMWCKDARAAA